MSVSLDGFIEGPNREIDWHRVDAELHQHFNEEIRKLGGLLEGRVTHELMAGFWPTADQDPHSTAEVAEFAGIWRDIPKYVYCADAGERRRAGTTILPGPGPGRGKGTQGTAGGDLGLGGAEPARPRSCGTTWSTSSGCTSIRC